MHWAAALVCCVLYLVSALVLRDHLFVYVLNGGIAVFGNAPVALLELNRMIIEDDIRPAVVIGLPVGFVHVVESKEELMSLPVPWIAIAGRRGGSTLAVSVVHALCTLAAQGERSSL